MGCISGFILFPPLLHSTFVFNCLEEVLACFKSFGQRFVKEVCSRDNHAFTAKLRLQNVIPERIENRIAAADDSESANYLLYDFLCQQATSESLSKLVAAVIEAEGHPAMNRLGREMKSTIILVHSK